jgi:hypothetical protein
VTLVEQARLLGIQSQLAVRGRTVTHVRSGFLFRALPEHRPGFKAQPGAESGEYAFGPEERSQDDFYILRSDLADTRIAVGDELASGEGSFRVLAVEDSPNNLLVRFTVEVARA